MHMSAGEISSSLPSSVISKIQASAPWEAIPRSPVRSISSSSLSAGGKEIRRPGVVVQMSATDERVSSHRVLPVSCLQDLCSLQLYSLAVTCIPWLLPLSKTLSSQ